jgi:carboxyl-terminal processing protease
VKTAHAWSLSALAAIVLVFVHEGTLLRIDQDFAPGAADLAGMNEIAEIISARWVEQPDDRQLLDGSLRGMVATLDRFSDYISPEQLEAFEESTTGRFGGLGIYINVNKEGRVVVIAPIEDTPAWKAGILPGDVIYEVDGIPCEFLNADAAVRSLKGEVGTSVELAVLHEGANKTILISIERAEIQIRSVKGGRLLDPVSKLGYLRITTFNSGTVDEFEQEAERLNALGMRGLILDLRRNPGGFLRAATLVADMFLEKGAVIVKTRGRTGGYKETRATKGALVTGPVAILLDRGSASASEILAGALWDHERAKLVGTRSYGKGSVQSIIPVLAGRAELKLTTQYYFTPKGRRIHRGEKPMTDLSWGLLPNVEVKVDRSQRAELTRKEAEAEMVRLKALANKKPVEIEERLHLDDPQARAAYRALLGELGDPVPADVPEKAAGSDVASVDSGTKPSGN